MRIEPRNLASMPALTRPATANPVMICPILEMIESTTAFSSPKLSLRGPADLQELIFKMTWPSFCTTSLREFTRVSGPAFLYQP
jgi:hypothetical protein